MKFIIIIPLLFIIFHTLKSLSDKKTVDEGQEQDNMFAGWLFLILFIAIIAVVLVLR